ncbi:hypothetical protein HPB48_019567 [Haemaphysalis longicornis]|uniref:Uncharacterized protein n=1 Tax=Haemaphysalis longicornis TaxID=44386 RepID=A0A9J6GN90_HAELO|nr:hypothetical protein HPB48_019567 [Haemaphysalis longicornis]
MSLFSVSCPANTLYKGMKPTPCVRIPVGASQICKIYPAYIQGEYYSVMTRRYTGGAVDSLTEDVFFETQHTVSKKAYLMLNQLKKAQVGPMAFVLRDYYLDLDAPATYTDHTGKPVPCTAQPFGIIKSTRAEIGKLI